MAQRLKTDWILFVTVLAMMSFGVLMLYSASSIMAQLDPRYGWSWHFVLRQVEWAAVAVAVAMAVRPLTVALTLTTQAPRRIRCRWLASPLSAAWWSPT